MTAIAEPSPVRTDETLADLIERIGSVPLNRIARWPAPGTATEADAAALLEQRRLFELVEGVLVEKAMGLHESFLAVKLIQWLGAFVEEHALGLVAGEGGAMRLFEGRIRIPDVSFVSWSQFPGRKVPRKPIPDLHPDLAVEVLSPSNTEAEMRLKVREFFASGTRLVWLVDPEKRTARVFTGPDRFEVVTEDGVLDGGDVLPGFNLSLRRWLDSVPRE
jgi:Uma2 family endonuclease